MKRNKSCGTAVYTVFDGGIRYLLVLEKADPVLSPRDTRSRAKRNRKPPAAKSRKKRGLDLCLVDGFRAESGHSLAREGHPEVFKRNVYFLAEYGGQEIRPQESEISRIEFMDYGAASDALASDLFCRVPAETDKSIKRKTVPISI